MLQEERVSLLASEDYLVGSEGLAFRQNCSVNSLIRGTAHALLLAKCKGLSSVAEEVAPGKGDLLLTELSYRALPGGSSWKDQLSLKGWHIHPTKLEVGVSEKWRGKPYQVESISSKELSDLLATPSASALKAAMKDSPLLKV